MIRRGIEIVHELPAVDLGYAAEDFRHDRTVDQSMTMQRTQFAPLNRNSTRTSSSMSLYPIVPPRGHQGPRSASGTTATPSGRR